MTRQADQQDQSGVATRSLPAREYHVSGRLVDDLRSNGAPESFLLKIKGIDEEPSSVAEKPPAAE